MRLSLTLGLIALFACSSKEREANQEAKRRIFGRDEPPSELMVKADETIDVTSLADDAKVRARVLEMRFDEVVVRLGFVEYKGLAKIDIERGRQRLRIIEESVIRQGLHGSFQVLQRDGEGNELRQGIWNNGVFYLSNGGGKMRVEGMTRDRHLIMREETWQPLRTFAAYYGQRFGLEKVGAAEHQGKTAIKYKMKLLEGPETIPGKDGDTAKKPISLEGYLLIDADKAVPVKAELEGELQVPAAAEGGEAGTIRVSLQYGLRPIEGEEIKPKSFIPTIERHPVDLAPLAFLDGGVRTSTVIGGGKKTPPRVPPSQTATKAP